MMTPTGYDGKVVQHASSKKQVATILWRFTPESGEPKVKKMTPNSSQDFSTHADGFAISVRGL
jgi:hypothetical protein